MTREIEALREEVERVREETAHRAEVAGRFQEVLAFLQELNLDEIWAEATDHEKRVLVEELVDVVAIWLPPPGCVCAAWSRDRSSGRSTRLAGWRLGG